MKMYKMGSKRHKTSECQKGNIKLLFTSDKSVVYS